MNSNTLTVLAGGESLIVLHTTAMKEEITVRKIPLRDMHKLGRVWGNEAAEIDLYADKKEGWHETLTDESWEQVIETGRRLNAVPFGKWYARHQQALAIAGVNVEALTKAALSDLPKPTSSS